MKWGLSIEAICIADVSPVDREAPPGVETFRTCWDATAEAVLRLQGFQREIDDEIRRLIASAVDGWSGPGLDGKVGHDAT